MKQLSLEEKQTVQTQLQAYVSKYPSQNKAVNSLGLSTGTVSAILNGKFDNISDEMFLRIRSLVPDQSGGVGRLRNDRLPGAVGSALRRAGESERLVGSRECRHRQDDDRARLRVEA